jgi:uncharacterized membrane protein YqiK
MSNPNDDLASVIAVVVVIIYVAWFFVAMRNRKGD